MDEIEALRREIETIKVEQSAQAEDVLALETVLMCIIGRLGNALPQSRPVLLQAFDDATNFAERVCIARGLSSSHVPTTLKIIEQLRMSVAGKSEPKHGV